MTTSDPFTDGDADAFIAERGEWIADHREWIAEMAARLEAAGRSEHYLAVVDRRLREREQKQSVAERQPGNALGTFNKGRSELTLDDMDVWAMRDMGLVDPELRTLLAERGQHGLNLDYEREPTIAQKRHALEQYEGLAEHLRSSNFDGRDHWTPREAWSMGRAAIARTHGFDADLTRFPTPWPAAAPSSNELRMQLLADVEDALPSDNGEPEPSTRILMLANAPDAPIITVSRDPRSGPKCVPVFFVAAADPTTLGELVTRLYRETNELAPLYHSMGREEQPFMMVPLMFHLAEADDFRTAVHQYLAGWAAHDVVYELDNCEVTIVHRGMAHKAVEASDQSRLFDVLSAPIDA